MGELGMAMGVFGPVRRVPTARRTTGMTSITMTLVSPRYLVISAGPATSFADSHILFEPLTEYNPVNGTVSSGSVYTTGDSGGW